MSDTIANRNDDQYSSTMNGLQVRTLPLDTSMFPAVWRHMSNDSICTHTPTCTDGVYAVGGRLNWGTPPTLAE